MIPGYAVDGDELIALVGKGRAAALFSLTIDAVKQLQERVSKYSIHCGLSQSGLVTLSFFPTSEEQARESVAEMNAVLGTQMEYWPPDKTKSLYKSKKYHHSLYDPFVFVVNPLNLTIGLARAAAQLGVTVSENTLVTHVTNSRSIKHAQEPSAPWQVHARTRGANSDGAEDECVISCEHVVLAGGSSLAPDVHASVSHSLLPLHTFIM